FHLLPALLDVAQIIDEQRLKARQTLEHPRQAEVSFGRKQLLHENRSRGVEHPASLAHEQMTKRTEKMGFAAAGIAERQHVLASIQEGAFLQGADLLLRAHR